MGANLNTLVNSFSWAFGPILPSIIYFSPSPEAIMVRFVIGDNKRDASLLTSSASKTLLAERTIGQQP